MRVALSFVASLLPDLWASPPVWAANSHHPVEDYVLKLGETRGRRIQDSLKQNYDRIVVPKVACMEMVDRIANTPRGSIRFSSRTESAA